MAVTIELENDELATLFFYIQQNEKYQNDPLMDKLILKMEALIYSRFSIDEIETYRNRVQGERCEGESK